VAEPPPLNEFDIPAFEAGYEILVTLLACRGALIACAT